jgi:glucan biosynthesis protein C
MARSREVTMGERKYFLDWLRVIAFCLLILFHVGMLYVTWSYNLKSERIFPDLELAMIALSPWRLVLLFFISGVASRFLLEKLSAGGFARDRLRRLLPVILLGIFVIIPPQVYVEMLSKGLVDSGYLEFWFGSYLTSASFPNRTLPTWDHLWFLVYLLFYALGLALIFQLRGPKKPHRVNVAVLFVLPGLWLCGSNILISELSPVTQAFVDDWANHIRWIGVFGAGVLCASQDEFWEGVRRIRLGLALFSLVLLAVQLGNGIYWRTGEADPFWDGIAYAVIAGIYGWVVVLALAGYAAEHLNRSSGLLSYLTEAVLPIYVVHQPILLIAAFFLFPAAMPVALEVALLIAITGVGSLAVYQFLVRRFSVMRFLFGLKKIPAS